MRTAVELARDDGWGPHGCAALDAGALLWAVFPEARRDDHRATVTLPDLRAACSCSATRFPCRHIIALLLRHHDGRLPDAAPPDGFAPPPAGPEPAVDPAERLPALIAGMADLRVWLGDLARRGMAGLPTARRDYWLAAADRLVDAYAFEAARELRDCAALPAGGVDWPERLLPRLGRLALLCEAFGRFDALTPAEQGDALIAAGQPPAAVGPPVSDRWLVLGRHFEIDGKQRHERVWLYGATSGRWALLAETVASGRQDGLCLAPGATVMGELAYLPGGHPLRAVAVNSFRIVNTGEGQPTFYTQAQSAPIHSTQAEPAPNHSTQAHSAPIHSTQAHSAPGHSTQAHSAPGHSTTGQPEQPPVAQPNQPTADPSTGIATLFRRYSAALAANPWHRHHPAALTGVFLEPPRAPTGDVWRARDRAGHTIPLPGRFHHGWQLLALAADRPLTLFGEWDGRVFTPLSVLEADGWRAMAGWRGVA